MHIYAFGSVCRGEISPESDVDLLAIVNLHEKLVEFDVQLYSVYSYDRIHAIWIEGNPFAWHLHLESAMIYSQDKTDFLKQLGAPSHYRNGAQDCQKFFSLFQSALESLTSQATTQTFDLSTMFLSMRNFATCYSLASRKAPTFSRNSCMILGEYCAPIDPDTYRIFERARILSTRGVGDALSAPEIESARQKTDGLLAWMNHLLKKGELYE